MVALSNDLDRFRDSLDKQLRSGLIGLILLAAVVRRGPDYGYSLLAAISESSGGNLAFQQGTAYPLLQRLEQQGLVTSFWGTGSGSRRRYYQATDLGKEALDAALDHWRSLSDNVTETLENLT